MMENLIRFSNPDNVFCYHYQQLGEKEKKLYRKLADGLFFFLPTITLLGTDSKTVESLYEKIKLDMPAAFFDEGIEVTWYPALFTVKVRPKYRFAMEDAENILKEIMERAEPLLGQCQGKTDLEKEIIIHDWFLSNVVYDHNYAQHMGGSSFEMAAPLLWGRGVCSGISKAAKFLFDLVGVPSLVMEGRTKDRPGMPGEEHCWLMVKIQTPQFGPVQPAVIRCHLDITFNMTAKTRRYFNMTSQEILEDRVLTGPFA